MSIFRGSIIEVASIIDKKSENRLRWLGLVKLAIDKENIC